MIDCAFAIRGVQVFRQIADLFILSLGVAAARPTNDTDVAARNERGQLFKVICDAKGRDLWHPPQVSCSPMMRRYHLAGLLA